VTRSGFYAWHSRPESTHARDDRRLKVLVRASFEESKHRYGSPRVHEDLLEQHEHVSRKRVVRLMQEDGLQARFRKRYKLTTMSDHDQPVAANLLDRQFTAATVNQRWVGDTTEFVIGESGKLYLAAILDLFSRFVVGWAISATNDRHLTIKALEMALTRRCPEMGLLHHSDRGSPYASEDYQAILEVHGLTCSMSRSHTIETIGVARNARKASRVGESSLYQPFNAFSSKVGRKPNGAPPRTTAVPGITRSRQLPGSSSRLNAPISTDSFSRFTRY
jgi:transposase InsO family protein